MKKNILIIDGTTGVGLELTKHYLAEKHTVCVTGPSDPQIPDCLFMPLLTSDD